MFGKLYLIATPIGNLGDITYRAVEILKEVDIIAAEDTRHSLKLLNYLDISKPMISYHRHNEDTKTETLINLLKDGKNIGLITDAGTPGISDPGEEVVKQAIKENIEIIPIPGACALINALIASGLNTKEFAFYGFLPLDKKLRNEKMEDIIGRYCGGCRKGKTGRVAPNSGKVAGSPRHPGYRISFGRKQHLVGSAADG